MLGRLLGTIDYHLDRAEEEWLRQSVERRRQGYGAIRAWVVGKARRPFALPAWLSLIAGGWTLAAILPVPDKLEWIIGRHPPEDVVTYFGVVWSVQAAIAALVYPIVI